jgi:hypothetical protein
MRQFNIVWEGEASIRVREGDKIIQDDCRGLCRDQKMVCIVKLLALDGRKVKEEPTFYDVKND